MSTLEQVRFIPRRRLDDAHGWFLKVIDGREEGLPAHTGEVYLTSALPGEARGDHYHPLCAEWFTLVSGRATLWLEAPDNGDRAHFDLDAGEPITVHVPAGIAHVFVNDADAREPFLLIAYAAELYDPADTVPFAVHRG